MKEKVLSILQNNYGYKTFRKGQEDIINSILNFDDVVAIMPTGGGKSLCYQIPALCMDGLTIVISPLISLMKDQVDTLNAMGIEAAFINSSLSINTYNEILEGIQSDKYKIIYIAPERLGNIEFFNIIKYKNISQIAIDEAHCISQWGHDFRSSYTKIPNFINQLQNRPVITAFTATASNEVRVDIIKMLNLINPKIYLTGFDRENLFINIVKSYPKNKYLLEYLENHGSESGIIYASTRKEVDDIYNGLTKRNIDVLRYHGGMSDEDRRINQEKFIKDEVSIIIATNAFGMGIDKSNIRWVVHYNMPQSIENYYQEIGRAGRDGERSECILLFSPADIQTHKYLIDNNIRNQDRKLVQYDKLQQMVDLVYSNSCYRKQILNYFGELMIDECENCSNCVNKGSIVDKTIDAQKVMSCILRMKRSYGINMIVDVLRGSKNKKVLELDFDKLSTYSIMKEYSNEDLKIFINTLVSHGFLEIKENLGSRGSFPTIALNNQSKRVLKNEIKVQFKENKVMTQTREKNKLFYILSDLTKKIALENNIAPYMVFGDATLLEMCEKYPNTEDKMLNISGVGQFKFDKYGNLFIDAIDKYVKENNIDLSKIEKDDSKKDSSKSQDEFFEVNTDAKLYENLKKLRVKLAKIERLPYHMIMTKNTLKEISGRYPLNEEELNDISGMGPKKIEKYKDELLKIVKDYVEENNIDVNWTYKKRKKLILDGESRKPKEIALDLLNQGIKATDVSKELEVSLSTVLGYIYDYIKDNNKINFEFDPTIYYCEEDKILIEDSIKKLGEEKVQSIKKSLPDTIQYEAIRAVIIEKYITQNI